jgi:hypothetical protein
MTRAAVAAAAIVVGVGGGGCGKRPTHHRDRDAAPVEVVTAPAQLDAGHGPAADEVEPNDSDEVATLLGLGATVHGKIDPETDVDRYRIDVTQPGALAVTLEAHDGLDAVLEIADAGGTVIARSDRTGPRTREGVPNLGVTPGRYTAIVAAKKPPPLAPPRRRSTHRPAPEPAAKPVGGPYEITAAIVPVAAGFEHEPDDDRGAASELIAGDTGSGYIGWAGDADVWKISVEALSAKNALDIELSAVEGLALSLEISDGIGQSITTRKGPRGGPLVVRGFVPALAQGAPPYHYLTVRADRSNPETAYQIRVTAKLVAPDAEIEPNDTPETATLVPLDRKSLHAQWTTGDVDCFAMPPADTQRTFDVALDTPRDLDLALDLLINGKLIEKVDHPGKGAAEKLVMTIPAGAHAVVRVRGADAAGEGGYDISFTESTASP